MKIFLVVALVVMASTSSAFDCPEADVVMGGKDYWFDYVPYVESWEDCGRICALVSQCNFWTWGTDSGGTGCYLYETDTGLGYDARYISGERGCPEGQ